MWVFKIRSHYCSEGRWVLIPHGVSFTTAKEAVEQYHYLDDWKWDAVGQFRSAFPLFDLKRGN